jgi:1-acyl-sn-glycerol-3-phosphate acyltransferase
MCLLKWVIVPFMKLYVRESKGFNNIPEIGPVILVSNHSSYIDAVLIRYFPDWLTGRVPRGIQSKEWIEESWLRRFIFLTILKQIPTDGSVERAIEALVKGEIVMLFPEGGRSADGKIQKCTHTGLGVIAEATGAPVIPIGIKGSFDWWPRQNFLPKLYKFRSIAIKAGKPMKFKGKKTDQNFLAFQKKVMQKVANLAGTKYKY